MSADVHQRAETSPSEKTERRRLYLITASLFLWPFVDLFPYTFNLAGIGNDFHNLYYNYKVYLLDCLSRGHLPLWSPSEASGFPFYSSPFAQAFYPLNLPLAVFYEIAGGYSAPDHQRFAILGISIFALGLFFWLRSMKISLHAALFAAFVMSVSFKVTEILRFPNAVHAMAWYPWALFSIHGIFASTSRRAVAAKGCLLAASLVCLVTAGYPYFAYYSIFLFVPYVGLFLIPRLRTPIVGIDTVNWRAAIIALSFATIAPFVVLAPYLYKVVTLMWQTTDRSGDDFAYSTAHAFNLEDTIGSLVYPPAASADGWFYFGIPGVLLLVLYVFGKSDRTHPSRGGTTAMVLLSWVAVISYVTFGSDSYLFLALWKIMPLFSSLRVWGRMNIILVPLIAWLLALAYANFEAALLAARSDEREKRRSIGVLTAGFFAIIGVQFYYFTHSIVDPYWTRYFVNPKAAAFPSMAEFLRTKLPLSFMVAGVVAYAFMLYVLLASAKRGRLTATAPLLLVCFIAISAADTTLVGPWVWVAKPKPAIRRELHVPEIDRASFETSRVDGHLTIALDSTFSVGTVPNWYFARYIRFRSPARTNEPNAYRQLMGLNDGRKLYFSNSIAHGSIGEFLEDSSSCRTEFQVRSYDGDMLVAEVDAPRSGYVSFIDNWDADWRAYVDGVPTAIELVFGTFKSVEVPRGHHRVVFRYEPWPIP